MRFCMVFTFNLGSCVAPCSILFNSVIVCKYQHLGWRGGPIANDCFLFCLQIALQTQLTTGPMPSEYRCMCSIRGKSIMPHTTSILQREPLSHARSTPTAVTDFARDNFAAVTSPESKQAIHTSLVVAVRIGWRVPPCGDSPHTINTPDLRTRCQLEIVRSGVATKTSCV